MNELREFSERHGLPWTTDASERFDDYVGLLLQFNSKMNLIGPLDRDRIERELLIDSIAPAVLVEPTGSLLDVGTGAGLPGLPLKILYPDVPTTLVEPRRKRATFLKIAAKRLELEDVEIVGERIGDVVLDTHDWVVSKAFRNPPRWLEIAAPLSSRFIVCMYASDAFSETIDRADELGLRQVAHSADVAAELGAPVPPGRAITVFAREARGSVGDQPNVTGETGVN